MLRWRLSHEPLETETEDDVRFPYHAVFLCPLSLPRFLIAFLHFFLAPAVQGSRSAFADQGQDIPWLHFQYDIVWHSRVHLVFVQAQTR